MTITTDTSSDALVIAAYCSIFSYDPNSGMTQEDFTIDRIKTQQIAATVQAYQQQQVAVPTL